MDLQAAARNPFLLLVEPETVLAAIEKSEPLERLNRHMCRPLDRPTPTSVRQPGDAEIDAEEGTLPASI